ncbi:hypothetical protein ACQPZA_18015 [Pseudonocardia xinjiangensis]|uniref:hypothetical protein n=1 Tax=Pseudonocardia xinjiangensis TaxID=75289 RepID=UPI003D92A773
MSAPAGVGHVRAGVLPAEGSRLRWALTDAATLTGRYLAHLRHQPAELAGAIGFPILLVLMFAFLLGGMMAVPGGGDYRQALLPGLFTMTMLFGLSATMVAVVTDAQQSPTGSARCPWRRRRCWSGGRRPTW